MGSRRITRVLDYPYPREMVWAAISEAPALADWLMPNDFRTEVGHEFTFQTDPAPGFDGTVHCKVLAVQPGFGWTLSWRAGALDTTLEISLEESAQGTRLTLVHDGFGARDVLPRVILWAGWKRLLRRKLNLKLQQDQKQQEDT